MKQPAGIMLFQGEYWIASTPQELQEVIDRFEEEDGHVSLLVVDPRHGIDFHKGLCRADTHVKLLTQYDVAQEPDDAKHLYIHPVFDPSAINFVKEQWGLVVFITF